MTAPVSEGIAARIEAAAAGSVRDIARLTTLVENGGDAAAEVARGLTGRPRAARIVGITGAPGAGKSTLTDALLRELRGGKNPPRIAVLAVDPSSPFTGGALLGDRVRMADWATDPGVYIRSLSSRGNLGGLSAGTPAAIDLLSALGFGLVIVETVGVGQSEVDVMHLADTVAVVLAPGMGDAVQAAKAGIMEIADVLVVNKADHEGARTTVRELRAMLLLSGAEGPWQTPIVQTKAHLGEGVRQLAAALAGHYRYLQSSGELTQRRARRSQAAVRTVVTETVRTALAGGSGRALVARAAERVLDGEADVYTAAAEVLAALRP